MNIDDYIKLGGMKTSKKDAESMEKFYKAIGYIGAGLLIGFGINEFSYYFGLEDYIQAIGAALLTFIVYGWIQKWRTKK